MFLHVRRLRAASARTPTSFCVSLLARTLNPWLSLCVTAEQHVRGCATTQTVAPASPGEIRPRYRFREGIWQVVCDQMGWPNTFVASKVLGVSDTTISRGLEGVPGERLMAAVMAALPRTWKFEHVFELAVDDEQVPA